MKRIIIVAMVFAYMNCYLGCTSTIMVPAANNKLDTTNNDKSLEIVTHDSTHYFFENNSYKFKNDTIIGMGKINNEVQQSWVEISSIKISEIHEEQKEYDSDKTIALIILGTPVVLIVGLAIAMMISGPWGK